MGNDYVIKPAVTSGATSAVVKTNADGTSSVVRVRRSIGRLTDDEIKQITNKMKSLNSATNTLYADLVRTHNANRGEVHSNSTTLKPLFLPWHRAFLMKFEQLLGDEMGDATFGLPYWDWTDDATTGRSALLWNDKRLGGWGTVGDGPFSGAQWPITAIPGVTSAASLTRAAATDTRPTRTRNDVMSVLRAASFPVFCRRLEFELHNYMHGWVGGQSGQMSSVPVSVNEPAFWLHHCNVDRIWAQWQELFPEQKTEATGMTADTQMPATLTQNGTGTGMVTVGSVDNAPGRVYRYDRLYQPNILWGADAQWPSATANYSSTGAPALAVYRQKLYCLRQERSNAGWTRGSSFDGTSWSGGDGLVNDENGETIGLSSSPAMASYHDRLYLLHEGRSDKGWVWQSVNHGTSWSADDLVPDRAKAYGTSGSPALAVYQDKLHCLRQGRDDEGWLYHGINNGAGWSTDVLVRDANGSTVGVTSSPAVAVYGGLLHCVRHGRGREESKLWWTTYDGTGWSADRLIPSSDAPYSINGSPALVAFAGRLLCVFETATGYHDDEQGGYRFDADGYLSWAAYDGTSWSAATRISDGTNSQFGTSGGPALAVFGGKLYCIREDRGNVGLLRCAIANFEAPATASNSLAVDNVTKPMINPYAGQPSGKTGMVSVGGSEPGPGIVNVAKPMVAPSPPVGGKVRI
jgi:hypothetical protein